MTSGQDNHSPDQRGPDQRDKVLDHTRLQLSALLDGALAPDQARFLLRRLQHDEDLAGCWSRWQLCGDVMRGQAGAALPGDFAPRVAAAIAADAVARPVTRPLPRWARWGSGAALAASVAVVALFVARQSPDAAVPVPGQAPAQIVAAATTTPQSRQQSPLPTPAAPDIAAQLAAVAAVAEVPRRAAARRSSRAQNQRAAIRTPARRSAEPQVLVAAAPPTPAVNIGTDVNPFAPRSTTITTRPWPRALLPNAVASGAFNVDYASSTAASPSFYPFQPRSMRVDSARPAATGETPVPSDDAPIANSPR